jgi:hypothetical protein
LRERDDAKRDDNGGRLHIADRRTRHGQRRGFV